MISEDKLKATMARTASKKTTFEKPWISPDLATLGQGQEADNKLQY